MYTWKASLFSLWPSQWLFSKDERREVASMKKVGRPRKAATKRNISVNLSEYTLTRLEDVLSWGKSRSKWIEDAIKYKLDPTASSTLADASIMQLISVLQQREIEPFLQRALQIAMRAILEKQVEEIEAGL